MKIHKKYFLVYQLLSYFLLYLQNYKEFEAEILDLQSEKYGLSFDIKKYPTSGWAQGDENVIGIRAFKNIDSQFSTKGYSGDNLQETDGFCDASLLVLVSIVYKPFVTKPYITVAKCDHLEAFEMILGARFLAGNLLSY